MSFIVCLIILLSMSVHADCDSIRTKIACEQTAPNAQNGFGCWWDSSADKTGHACKAFSGDCHSINTTFADECNNAGRGGKCTHLPNKVCGNVCSRLVSGTSTGADCMGEDYCYWDDVTVPATPICKSCEIPVSTGVCATGSGCRYVGGACVRECERLFSSDKDGCDAAGSGCYWDAGSCYYGPRPPPPAATCSKHNGNKGLCDGNDTCYYDSVSATCKSFWTGSCPYIKSNVRTDCTNAGPANSCKWNPGRGCESACSSPSTTCSIRDDCWTDGLVCKDFDGNCALITAAGCAGAGFNKCFYNNTGTGTGSCLNKLSVECIGLNEGNCSAYGPSVGCKWNSSSCVASCDRLLNVNDCYDRNDCYWSGGCNDNYPYADTACGSISNQQICEGRTDCFWSSCYSNCRNFYGCNATNYFSCISDDCNSNKRCVYDSKDNLCVDEIYAPITGFLNCSGHYESAACNADVLPDGGGKRCVWNSNYDNIGTGNGKCVEYPAAGCRSIKYPVVGGAFYNPGDDCQAAGCAWVPTDLSGGVPSCSQVTGVCIEKLGTDKIPDCFNLEREYCERATGVCFWHDSNYCTVRCSNTYYPDSEKCYGAAVGTGSTTSVPSGCFWSYGSGYWGGTCSEKTCTLVNGDHETADIENYCKALGSQCEYHDDGSSCQNNCSLYPASRCVDATHCYLRGNVCSYLSSSLKCSEITDSFLCNYLNCYWKSSDSNDYEVGECFDEYVVKNTMIRGCDDIINKQECETFEYRAKEHPSSRQCSFIDGKCVLDVVVSTICTTLGNEEQCIINPECYWTTYSYGCREFKTCKDIYDSSRTYAWNSIVCNNRRDCIWDSYTKGCEVLGSVADFYNASKDCKNKGGHLVNDTCYDNYDVAAVTSCGSYDEKSCNGDNILTGTKGCSGKENRGCYWDGNACVAFEKCSDIVNEKTCNNKYGCYFGQGVCNKVVCSQYTDTLTCDTKKECFYVGGCYPIENFPKAGCEDYSSTYSSFDATKGTGEGCTGSLQPCNGYLLEEICNSYSNCVWDDYRKICISGTYSSNSLSNEYARQRMCLEKRNYWDGSYCRAGYGESQKMENKCQDLNDPLSCNFDEQSCRLGCVWNSNISNASCHLFFGCSYIAEPNHAFAERDCKAKKECMWDGDKCKNSIFCQYRTSADCNENPYCIWNSNEYTCKIRDTCRDVPSSECGTNENCWCDKHYRPPRNKPITRCLDIQSESECGRLGPARGCRWQSADTTATGFPLGICLEIPTPTDCDVITEPRQCQNQTMPCVWNYVSKKCIIFSDCPSVTSKADCRGKSGCVWKADKCYTIDDCAQCTTENECNDHYNGNTCVYAWSSDRSTGTCVRKVGCGVFTNRDQCFINAPCFWKNSNNANKGNCFASKADAGIFGEDIVTGIHPYITSRISAQLNCSELCDESDCRNSNLYPSSNNCYWDGKCRPYTAPSCPSVTDVGTCDKTTNCIWNSSFDGNRGRCETGGCSDIRVNFNPLAGKDCTRKAFCAWSSSSATCSATYACSYSSNAIDCAALPHCYWQSNPSPISNGTCTYFWGCGEIENQTDCQEKGCGWNKKNKACGDGPKSKAKWSKGAVASTVVLAVLLGLAVVAIAVGVLLFILWSRKKKGVANSDESAGAGNSDESTKVANSDEETTPLLKSNFVSGPSNDGSAPTEQAVSDAAVTDTGVSDSGDSN